MMDAIPWKCCGCGIPTPMRVERCNCPTGVVFTSQPHRSAGKFRGPIGMMSIAYVAVRALAQQAEASPQPSEARGRTDASLTSGTNQSNLKEERS